MSFANVLEKKEFKEGEVNKVTYIKTDQLVGDTYYFRPGQVLPYHRHPEGDQIFFIHEGEGEFYTDDGKEERFLLRSGVTVLAPRNVWHKVVNTGETPLIASQVTRFPGGMEKRG